MLMFLLLLGAVICDVAGQVSFKLGLSERNPSGRDAATDGVGGFLRGLAASRFMRWSSCCGSPRCRWRR
jgi:hypothetical protein